MNPKRWLIAVILCALGFATHAHAEGFSVGGAVGLPTLLEARVGYDAPEFGVRAYITALSTVIGADAYAKFPLGWMTIRLGGGVFSFSPFTELGFRALIGFVFQLEPNVFLVSELRPMFIPSLLSGASGERGVVFGIFSHLALAMTLISFSVSLEFHF